MRGKGKRSWSGRTYSLREMDEAILRLTSGIDLTLEDAILLLLRADPRPIRGIAGLTRQVLAVTGPLALSGVEPAAFFLGRSGRRPPRSGDVECAAEQFAFARCIDLSGGRGLITVGFAIPKAPLQGASMSLAAVAGAAPISGSLRGGWIAPRKSTRAFQPP